MNDLRKQCRAMNAASLAAAMGVDVTVLRRWIAGAVNPEMEAAVRRHLGHE